MYSTCSTAGITLFFTIALDVVSPWVELLFVCCKNVIVNREAALKAEDPLEKHFRSLHLSRMQILSVMKK